MNVARRRRQLCVGDHLRRSLFPPHSKRRSHGVLDTNDEKRGTAVCHGPRGQQPPEFKSSSTRHAKTQQAPDHPIRGLLFLTRGVSHEIWKPLRPLGRRESRGMTFQVRATGFPGFALSEMRGPCSWIAVR